VEIVARYSFIDATYIDGFTEHSPNNSSADGNGDIQVAGGARMPSIPRNTFRLRVDGHVVASWSLGANLTLNGASYARGDENNRDAGGRVAGYAVLNLDTTWEFARGMALFARANNVFDRKYANFGILGSNVFANAARTFDPANARSETFLGQGTPFGAWVGVRFDWR
jgi:outer membrane receptor protein involved in Fe transport